MSSDEPDTTEEVPRPTRYFTPAEANGLLPELVAHVATISDHLERVRSLSESARVAPEDERDRLGDEIDQLRRDIEANIAAIQQEGVDVKGLAPGLLDFPALFNGQEVYLCWREGETAIEWWHPLHTGYSGRQRLDPKSLAAWEWEN